MAEPASLSDLTYGAMCVPGGMPVEVRRADVHAWAFPPEMSHLGGWLMFDFRGEPSARQAPGGWKVHLSVDTVRLAEAWDALLPVVADVPVLAKVANPGLLASVSEGRQAGKGIVLYADGCPHGSNPGFWTHLLSRAETALRAAGIAAGPHVLGDMPLADSSYAHVRADKAPDGRYSCEPQAFNPFGFPCPFAKVRVSGEGRPVAPVGDPAERIVRMLGFVEPGWEPVDDGFVLWADDPASAAMTAKAMRVAGLDPSADGEVVRLQSVSEGKVARRWHEAMELRRAAEVGDLVRKALDGAAGLAVGRRANLSAPPVIRLSLAGEECARAVADALSEVFAHPPMSVAGNVLSIPYGGRIHVASDLRPKWFGRVSDLVSAAAATSGCRPPGP